MDTQNDGLEKVDSFETWPFLVSILDFWGVSHERLWKCPQSPGKDLGHSRDMKEFLIDFCFDSLEDAVKEQLDSMSIWVVVSNICYFFPDPWEMIQFDEHIFQKGWFNHQLAMFLPEMVDFHLGHHPWSLCKWVDATMYVG